MILILSTTYLIILLNTLASRAGLGNSVREQQGINSCLVPDFFLHNNKYKF